MRNTYGKGVASFACAAVLSFGLVACGQPAGQSTADEPAAEEPATEEQAAESETTSQRNESDPTADGRIDVTTTGSQTATFYGPKYIVSDVTVDQKTGEAITEGLGLQEICVVDQPWDRIDSIGWDRNSISYAGIATSWGKVSYRYEYVNEASGVDTTQEFSRSTEEAYFHGAEGVEHVTVGDHNVAYVTEEATDPSMGFEDLEAQADEGEGSGEASSRVMSVYAFEQRAQKCAFLTTITCEVTDESAFDQTGADLLAAAYEPLSFADKGASVEAASFLSDVVVESGDGSSRATIRRNGDALLSYTAHSALLLVDNDDEMQTILYDFAPAEDPYDDAQEYEVGGREVRAFADDDVVTAWLDVDGKPLCVEVYGLEGSEVQELLDSVIANRIEVAQ